ncbi:HAD-IIB family hydrolase [Rossellomorea marisflavi]|uniref:HAD-IIB family hydrolase n=1 Tax=Rossellomorea marisflavi TaxID=189381 RepID=UPI003D2F1340
MPQDVYHSTGETRYIAFFDFDETYFPHACTEEQLMMVHELEEYLQWLASEQHVKIGWVTGSSLTQVEEKMKKARMRYLPHFISSNLGTEMWEVHASQCYRPIPEWEKRIARSGFSHGVVQEILDDLKNIYSIKLTPQTQFGQGTYKMNYYYYPASDTGVDYHLGIIRQLAFNHGVGININRCNPKAGDPENAYDVDFIPKGTGKKAAVSFMKKHYNVPSSRTLAFGDSGNDLEMVKAVEHGYLLGNATEEAKRKHHFITEGEYGKGIMEVCGRVFSRKEWDSAMEK